ncbi:MAG: acetyl-CoA carboxylase biotin carboxylase subunit [Acidobacteria bacterium]|nr:acetyl-CoA carboxylase biotin carboxylase subunit [Acidobacteriota bacterium]
MFRRLLVANRGEVAVRIARTCRRLGVKPVAVYSEADAGAPWLAHFEAAVCIGPAHPGRSYLDQEAILQAAIQQDCQAIHPGWGFLAENALFATRVSQLRIAWVGPTPRAIRLMGDKALARETVAGLGLPTIPGSEGVLRDAGEAVERAAGIGFPVLLKASAGGGGRGMRVVRSADELARAFADAGREAGASFGDPSLYMEKYIERGRHIEFQVLGDGFGNAVHLGERECSVQRRHQKLVEEAPSPVLDPRTREELGARIVHALAALGYQGAGTMEFLRDAGGALYFMEMNTRLQVEHPVTEMTTGIDIVEHQLRVAAGERLGIATGDVAWDGHAIEARINAEDPARDFQPAPGRIARFEFPADLGPGRVRIDTHIEPPAEVPPFYDSLVAKVIAHGRTRGDAIETLRRCLATARVEGVPTTIPAHLKILAHPGFASGDYDTSLLSDRSVLES